MAFRDLMGVADDAIIAGLGETAYLVTDAGANLGAVVGLFEHQYVEVLGTESMTPTFSCRTTALPTDTHDYKLTYDSITYTVARPEPDGTGMTLLILEKT